MANCYIYSIVLFLLVTLIGGDLLSTVIEQFQPHQDVYILSDSILEEDKIQGLEVSKKFLYSAYLNATTESDSINNELLNIIKGIFQSREDVTIIVCISSEDRTMRALEYIGNVNIALREVRRIWTVIIWPKSFATELEISSIRRNKTYLDAVKNFHTNSYLFLTFELISSSDANNRTILTYESYRAGNYTVFRRLQKGIIQWDCRFCDGTSLRRFNFHRRKLKVTAVNDSEINDDLHVYVDSAGVISYGMDGFSGSLLGILQQMLNFTVEPMMSPKFGQLNPKTNLWDGSIGEIANGSADIAISVTIYQPDRAKVVSFLPPSDEHLIDAFFKTPETNTVRDIFSQPFKPTLWAVVLITWTLLASSMIMFSIIRKRYGLDQSNDLDTDESEPDFARDSFMWALGTICQQGWEDHPKAGSLRTIFLSGSFSGVVAYAGYSGAIVSTLSVSRDPISSPMELLSSNLNVGVRKGFISTLLYQENARDTMSLFYKKVEHSREFERYLNVSAGFERLQKHPYAFITTRDTMYDLMKFTTDDEVICGIKDMSMLKYGFPLGYPVPKFSPFREILRYAMTMIREPGVLNRLRMKYAFQRRCRESSNNAGQALGAADVFTAFMILSGGFVLSLSFLAIERMIPFYKYRYLR